MVEKAKLSVIQGKEKRAWERGTEHGFQFVSVIVWLEKPTNYGLVGETKTKERKEVGKGFRLEERGQADTRGEIKGQLSGVARKDMGNRMTTLERFEKGEKRFETQERQLRDWTSRPGRRNVEKVGGKSEGNKPTRRERTDRQQPAH